MELTPHHPTPRTCKRQRPPLSLKVLFLQAPQAAHGVASHLMKLHFGNRRSTLTQSLLMLPYFGAYGDCPSSKCFKCPLLSANLISFCKLDFFCRLEQLETLFMFTSVLQMNTQLQKAPLFFGFFLTYVCISKLGLGGFCYIPRSIWSSFGLLFLFGTACSQPPGDSLNTRQHVWGMPLFLIP